MIAVSYSLVFSIAVPALIVITGLLFPIAQRRGAAAFRPRTSSMVVQGTRVEWLQQCCDGLESARHFSVVEVSEYDYKIEAKYRLPPLWAQLTVELLFEEEDATRINATVNLSPNLFTWLTSPEWRILGRFARAVGAPSEPHPRTRILR